MDELYTSELRDLFVDESQGYLQTLNACLLALEGNPGDTDAIHAMFRAAHSLKGGAAMMGYETLADLAHAAEDLLHRLRDGEWKLTPALTDLFFQAIDGLQSLVAAVATGGQPGADITAILRQLRDYTPEESPALDLDRGQAPAQELWLDEEVEPPPPTVSTAQPEAPEPGQTRIVRVDVRHLDTLLNIVTEMITHRSLLDRLVQRHVLPELGNALDIHDRLLRQLRDAVLEMRTVPVSQVFDRFPRMVRDLLQAEHKEARLIVRSDGVEMDRAALEALAEPLVHLLRNAIDHGLESPAARRAAGKPPEGMLQLSAWQERDMVVVEVRDDGRGMDPVEIAGAAVARGIASKEAVAAMSQEQVLDMICHPGFSLKEGVTAVSGRGVGMNVVKRQVECLRGSLKIVTQPGQGSTFRLRVPAQLALMPVVLVGVGSETYALPMAWVEQIVELDPLSIRRAGEQEIFSLHGNSLPLHRLGTLLDVPDAAAVPRYAVLIQQEDRWQGLGVDAVKSCEEVVVEPLPDLLRNVPGLSGATILGEGQTVLILDKPL